MDDRELIWNNYKLSIDLYRYYLQLIIKINIFYYAITGAILSYYFLHKEDNGLALYSLILPLLMSLGLAILFLYGANRAAITRNDIINMATTLEFEAAPETRVLIFLLYVFAIIFILVFIGLFIYLYKYV